MAQVTAANYYRRWIAQVVRQVVSFGAEQSVPLILAILILWYQLHYGLIQKNQLHSNELAIFWPYLELLATYLGFQIVRAPLVLDRQRADLIEQKTTRIAELTMPRVRITFQQLAFAQWGIAPKIILTLKIATGSEPVTLGDWELRSETGSLRHPFIGFDEMHGYQRFRFESNHELEGFFQFDGNCDPKKQWYFCFTDNRDQSYKELIPKEIYTKS
jgi:hypothetical protein